VYTENCLEAIMVTPKTGSVKKVQFCAAVALALCSLGAGAAELADPMDKVQRQLSEKIEQTLSKQLQQQQGKAQDRAQQNREAPPFPARIVEEQEPSQGTSLTFGGARWAAP